MARLTTLIVGAAAVVIGFFALSDSGAGGTGSVGDPGTNVPANEQGDTVGGETVATANGYQLRKLSTGYYAVVGRDRGVVGTYDNVRDAASVANSRNSNGGFAPDETKILSYFRVRGESLPSGVDTSQDASPTRARTGDGIVTSDSNVTVDRSSFAGTPTADSGDSQVYGALPEDEDDDINRVGNLSDRNATIFDRLANYDDASNL